jgi:hypothetical protein
MSGESTMSPRRAKSIQQHAAHSPAISGRHVRTGIRQSMPSVSIDSCDGVSDTMPSRACGQMKWPRSSRLAYSTRPWPSQNRIFKR